MQRCIWTRVLRVQMAVGRRILGPLLVLLGTFWDHFGVFWAPGALLGAPGVERLICSCFWGPKWLPKGSQNVCKPPGLRFVSPRAAAIRCNVCPAGQTLHRPGGVTSARGVSFFPYFSVFFSHARFLLFFTAFLTLRGGFRLILDRPESHLDL